MPKRWRNMQQLLAKASGLNPNITFEINDANKTHILATIYKNDIRTTDIGGVCVQINQLEPYLKRLKPGKLTYEIEFDPSFPKTTDDLDYAHDEMCACGGGPKLEHCEVCRDCL